MTFVGGLSMPSRIFRYAEYPISRFNRPMPRLPATQIVFLIPDAMVSLSHMAAVAWTVWIYSGGPKFRVDIFILSCDKRHVGLRLQRPRLAMRRPGI
jgi:hypothetical protein